MDAGSRKIWAVAPTSRRPIPFSHGLVGNVAGGLWRSRPDRRIFSDAREHSACDLYGRCNFNGAGSLWIQFGKYRWVDAIGACLRPARIRDQPALHRGPARLGTIRADRPVN